MRNSLQSPVGKNLKTVKKRNTTINNNSMFNVTGKITSSNHKRKVPSFIQRSIAVEAFDSNQKKVEPSIIQKEVLSYLKFSKLKI